MFHPCRSLPAAWCVCRKGHARSRAFPLIHQKPKRPHKAALRSSESVGEGGDPLLSINARRAGIEPASSPPGQRTPIHQKPKAPARHRGCPFSGSAAPSFTQNHRPVLRRPRVRGQPPRCPPPAARPRPTPPSRWRKSPRRPCQRRPLSYPSPFRRLRRAWTRGPESRCRGAAPSPIRRIRRSA